MMKTMKMMKTNDNDGGDEDHCDVEHEVRTMMKKGLA